MKKNIIISFLAFTNLISIFLAFVFFSEMRKNLDDLGAEELHVLEHAEFDITRFRQYIMKSNSGISKSEFIKLYKVSDVDIAETENHTTIFVDTLMFTFNGEKLISVQ